MIDDEALANLTWIMAEIRATYDVAELIEPTVRFHLKLAVVAQNPVLTGFLRHILNRMAILGLGDVVRIPNTKQ